MRALAAALVVGSSAVVAQEGPDSLPSIPNFAPLTAPAAPATPATPLGKLPEVTGTVLPESASAVDPKMPAPATPGAVVVPGAAPAPAMIDGKPCVDCPRPPPARKPPKSSAARSTSKRHR